jgi:3-deoxy-D-arabino-heptulosonate 7-phosphate (DAHP) synthase class II
VSIDCSVGWLLSEPLDLIDQSSSQFSHRAYFHSSAIINHIRGLLQSGLANLHKPSSWSFAHVRSPSLQAKFQDIVERLEDSLDFMKTIGANAPSEGTLGILDTVEIWTSHEVRDAIIERCRKNADADRHFRLFY